MTVTYDDLLQQFTLLRSDPARFLALTEQFIAQNPSDSSGYFTRHQIRMRLEEPQRALEDINRAIALEPGATQIECRGWVYRHLGDYRKAIEDFDRAEALDPEDWAGGFGFLIRAECHARLGNKHAALADCARLPEDHWTPGSFGLPAGNKADVAAALQRLADAAARA